MTKRLVIADASPLIGLAAAGAFDLLRGLFLRVTVTTTVRDEVLAGGDLPGARELAAAIEDGWIEVAPISPGAEFTELDAGEAGTLTLALHHAETCLVLMDEPLGRSPAKARGLAATGVAGTLLAAREAGLVSNLRTILDRLESANFRLSNRIVRAVLEQAGEA